MTVMTSKVARAAHFFLFFLMKTAFHEGGRYV